MSTLHSQRARAFNADPGRVTRHDKTFWGVRANRDARASELPEWEKLREAADGIKRHTVTHLADYLEQFARQAESHGATVHWAEDEAGYMAIVSSLMEKAGVRKVVKSKSMLTEELHLNAHLQEQGIEVVETDLGERILQLMELAPSHIVMPAIHITKEEVADCFRAKGVLKAPPEGVPECDPTHLTRCAREHLREHFMTAQCGMTGANFGVASTGDIVVCTNEGNADMSTSVPPLHIVSVGIEKIVPDLDALAVFQRLLARHGTGQATTVYTSHFRGPRPGGEMHIILVDNGRSRILADADHWQTLKCMRCGACMNTCPVYRRSGGYSYTYFIPGPIGVNLGMLRSPDQNYHNVSACSLCCSCDNVCPVRVDLSSQIYRWRQQLDGFHHADPMKKAMSAGMAAMFGRPALYHAAQSMAPAANLLPKFVTGVRLNAWAYGHAMPKFPGKTFREWFASRVDELTS